MIYELNKMSEEDSYLINLKCVRSYVWFHESRYYQNIVSQVLSHTNYRWEEAVRWWVSNSARAIKNKATGFIFSLKASTYSNSKQKIGYKQVKNLVHFLEQNGYVDVYKGYVKSWKVVNGRQVPEEQIPSCMILKNKSLELWDGAKFTFNLWKEQEDGDLAIIRNRGSKDTLPVRGHKGFKEIKREVREINDWLENVDITYQDKPIANVAYRRIFTDDMNKGGRLYALGGGVQLLPQRIRHSALKIDGESVVELDYSCIHPYICYQRLYNNEGMNVYDVLGKNFSPYDADLSFLSIDGRMKEEWERITNRQHNPVRSLAKLAILIGMNSSDAAGAAWTLGNKVKQDRAMRLIGDQEFYALNIKDNQYSLVLEAVCNHNDLIKDKFFSDAGIYLQNTDSKIMMSIVGAMGAKGHAVLAYHDSVLVKASAEDDLREAMYSAWKDVLGDATFCKVEKKL